MSFKENEDGVKLMLEFQDGDEEAFNKIVDNFKSPLINFIYRYTGNLPDAEDLAQEVFIRIYKAKDKYTPIAKFSTWMFRIAANLCLDYKKKQKSDSLYNRKLLFARNKEGEEIQEETYDNSEKGIEQSLELLETGKAVQEALFSIPENQRLAIILKVYEDKSYEEIAEILGVSVSSVESLLFRARQNLKKLLVDKNK